MAHTSLTEAEWSVMDALWERGGLTGREASELLRERCGWSRSTVLTLLGRLEAKGAVSGETEGGVKLYRPLTGREDAAVSETRGFPRQSIQRQRQPDAERHDEKTSPLARGDRRAV